MLLSVVSDPRLVLARLARQLVELSASRDGHAATRERLALETREVFAPLANRLGLWQLKWELEDLAFRFLQPDDYRRIAAALAEKRADRERYITESVPHAGSMMRLPGITAEMYGRPKHIYSIHRKMERKQLSLRAGVRSARGAHRRPRTVADCYAALGPGAWTLHLHSRRVRRLHRDAEGQLLPLDPYRGVRARRQGGRSADPHAGNARPGGARAWQRTGATRNRAHTMCPTTARSNGCASCWTRRTAGRRGSSGTSSTRCAPSCSRIASMRSRPRVRSWTCRPAATPLDFAYHVHTDLGHRCRGARVNGRIVPLTRALANGEVVEILTHKLPQPSRDWLSETSGFLVSPRSSLQGARLVPEVRRGSGAGWRRRPPAAAPAAPRRAPRRKGAARKTGTLPGAARGRRGSAYQLGALLRAGEARAHRRLRHRGARRDHPSQPIARD